MAPTDVFSESRHSILTAVYMLREQMKYMECHILVYSVLRSPNSYWFWIFSSQYPIKHPTDGLLTDSHLKYNCTTIILVFLCKTWLR